MDWPDFSTGSGWCMLRDGVREPFQRRLRIRTRGYRTQTTTPSPTLEMSPLVALNYETHLLHDAGVVWVQTASLPRLKGHHEVVDTGKPLFTAAGELFVHRETSTYLLSTVGHSLLVRARWDNIPLYPLKLATVASKDLVDRDQGTWSPLSRLSFWDLLPVSSTDCGQRRHLSPMSLSVALQRASPIQDN